MIEKRKLERFYLNLPVSLQVDNIVHDDIQTGDISSQGMFVLTNKPIVVGTTVKVEVHMLIGLVKRDNSVSKLNVEGKVVRAEKNGLAIQFSHTCKILN